MGCFEDRLKHEEELLLQYNEQQLGFSQQSTRQVAEALLDFPAQFDLETFSAVKRKVGLSDLHISPFVLDRFYGHFCAPGGRLMQRGKLIILAIVLTTDDLYNKARILFSLCEQNDHHITRSSLRPHVSFAFALATEVIPNTLSQNISNRFPEANLTDYLDRLRIKRPSAVEAFLERLFGRRSELSFQDFLKSLREQNLGRCLITKGAREFIVAPGNVALKVKGESW